MVNHRHYSTAAAASKADAEVTEASDSGAIDIAKKTAKVTPKGRSGRWHCLNKKWNFGCKLLVLLFGLAAAWRQLHSSSSSHLSSPLTDDTATSTSRKIPDYCQFYDGVLWISQGDRNGAAGTIFFFFILNQLLYAQRYNLQPWIHLTDYSQHVHDDQVHASSSSFLTRVYELGPELQVAWDRYQDPVVPDKTFFYPGAPKLDSVKHDTTTKITVHGTGIWDSYFQSTVPLQFTTSNTTTTTKTYQVDITQPCPHKPFVHFTSVQALVQGFHLNCPYCLRAWKYGGMPPSLRIPTSYQDWWHPMRIIGHDMIHKYYHPRSSLLEVLSQQAVQPPTSSLSIHDANNHPRCLAVHIRHSDKANKRTKIPLAAFLPYCQAFVEVMTGNATLNHNNQDGNNNINKDFYIYLATDSSRIIDKIQSEWPTHIVQHMKWQHNIVRTSNATAVFDAVLQPASQDNPTNTTNTKGRHHRTNTEVLVDILAMSRCQWFLHGLSAVSEATFYVAGPHLHHHSVNLEFYQYYHKRRQVDGGKGDTTLSNDAPMPVDVFRERLRLES